MAMEKFLRILLVSVVAIASTLHLHGQDIVRKGERAPMDSIPQVIIDGDTVDVIIRQPNFGRFDRGLLNYIFIPRNKWGFGITASYGELKTEDIQVLSILQDFDFSGKMYSVKPYFAYFFGNNQSIGVRVNYSRGIADLAGMSFNFGDDMSFAIRDVSYYQHSTSISTFYRAYVGLDRGGRFGVFNEVDLSFGTGSSRFKRLYGGEPRDTRTITTMGALNFSPGVQIFVMDYVSFNVSFGVFGLQWKKERQSTNDVDEGSRVTSGANFRFNLFNINFGLMVVI